MSRSVCWWMVTFATFQNVPVPMQMVRTLLFINQIIQVWYQNEEDIQLLPMICSSTASYDMLLIGLRWNISGKKWTFRSVQELFCWEYNKKYKMTIAKLHSYNAWISVSEQTTALWQCTEVNLRCSVLCWAAVDNNRYISNTHALHWSMNGS